MFPCPCVLVLSLGDIQWNHIGIKKDVDVLGKWKDELKKERDEAARRIWAFGPNIVGAIISGIISFVTAMLVVWLNKPQ